MRVEVMELIWQDVGVWDKIELIPAEPLLHLHKVVAEAVLPRDFIALREMVNPLMLVKSLVHVALA